MKSTTVRFAEPVYERMERASRLFGLPINSIVTVACLDWLQRHPVFADPVTLHQPTPTRSGRSGPPKAAVRPVPGWPGDPLGVFTACAREALALARDLAERSGDSWIDSVHLLAALWQVEGSLAARALRTLRVDIPAILTLHGAEPPPPPAGPAGPRPTRQLRQLLRRADEAAGAEARISTDLLLLALIADSGSEVARALRQAGASEDGIRAVLHGIHFED